MKNLVIAGVLGDEAARTSDALPVPPARGLFPPKTRLRKTCKFAATFAFLGRKGPFCATKMFYIHFVKFFVKIDLKTRCFAMKKGLFAVSFMVLQNFHISCILPKLPFLRTVVPQWFSGNA